MCLSEQMAAVVANAVIGNPSFTELQCYRLARLCEVTSFFLDSPAKDFTAFPHLGFAQTEYNAFQGPDRKSVV